MVCVAVLGWTHASLPQIILLRHQMIAQDTQKYSPQRIYAVETPYTSRSLHQEFFNFLVSICHTG